MRFTIATLLAFAATGVYSAATNIDLFTDSSCGNYETTVQTDESDGSCQQLPGILSVRSTSVRAGCSGKAHSSSFPRLFCSKMSILMLTGR